MTEGGRRRDTIFRSIAGYENDPIGRMVGSMNVRNVCVCVCVCEYEISIDWSAGMMCVKKDQCKEEAM